mgnify:CR=1 FL=1
MVLNFNKYVPLVLYHPDFNILFTYMFVTQYGYPLHRAIRNDNLEIIQLLIAYGANVNLPNDVC